MTETDKSIPVLGDIVERSVGGVEDTADVAHNRGSLRPIQAVLGRPFPSLRSNHFYGLHTSSERHHLHDGAPATTNITTTTASAAPGGFTAHVQPTLNDSGDQAGMCLREGVGGLASMARQHQWEPKEFDDLEKGYYAVPLFSSTGEPATAEGASDVVHGEAYVELLLRFLCSTVRKHRECATAALLERLGVDSKLRERCAFGPGCAQLVRFIIMELSAGHAVPCSTSAECLVHLFYNATAEVVEATGEIGAPPTDPTASSSDTKGTTADDATFAELSEWMRSGEDRSLTMERLGLTVAVMDALGLLPPSLAARLLLGSGTPS
ncbi:hypothetical protein DQ04_01571150, partial [Trypanosoma grayi]|uniref:hypothetical protein n=1 Tax=Trypanosoma grayi TaxID=71804 RepID=UPI0004F3F4F3